MDLPVMPPVKPMLAKSVPEIPPGMSYEPKWDGFRSIVFADGDEVELGSRNERPITRYFPEVVAALQGQLPQPCVIDGEIIRVTPDGHHLDFEALQARIHPAASRIKLLAETTPAAFVAFDLLALGDRDLMTEPFSARRALLEELFAGLRPPLHLTPATTDRDEAVRWFDAFEGAGLDGVVAKPLDLAHAPDKRTMAKIKHVRTADCVVAGFRTHKTDDQAVGSLMLGLYDGNGRLAFVGVIGAFPMKRRRELYAELQPLISEWPGHPWNWADLQADPDVRSPRKAEGSRWNNGKDMSFVPLRPTLVVEARYDFMEGTRFRHTAQFQRWRPDREPSSCTFDQLESPAAFDLTRILG